jgi:hypothetical protein
MKRMCMLGCLAVGVLASGCSAASTSRSAEGSGSGVGLSPASPAPTADSPQPCYAAGLRIDALPVGIHVEHAEQDALQAAAAAQVGPSSHLRVYVAWVQDPVADKVSLGDNAQFRVMWVLDGTDTTATPSPGELIAPASSAGAASPGTVYRTITLIDDQSMKLGGNFDCGSTNTVNSPDSPRPSAPSASSSPSPTCSAFALSLASDRGGQSSPIKAASWFAQHGSVQGTPKVGWKVVSTGKAEAAVQSGGVQLHVIEGPDQTWQVDSGQYYCP